MVEKEEAKKSSSKIRVWVKRETHDKVKEAAKLQKKSLIETYEHLVNAGLAFDKAEGS